MASCQEAFKLVNDAFGVLSDKALRESYDGKVDLEIREKMRTFWTACSTCRVLHQFERRYLGHKLVCPGCNKSFKAVEAVENDGSEEDEEDNTLGDFILKNKKRKKNGKMGCEKGECFKNNGKMGCEKDESFKGNEEVSGEKGVSFKGDGEVGVVGRMRMRKRTRLVGEVLESSESKKADGSEEESMTLADFQSKVKTKRKVEKEKMKVLEIGKGFEVQEKKDESSVERKELRLEKHKDFSGEELEAMAVVDSDFYDFDKDRVVKSFKKGQVWAVYDGDDDGMPRQYALIDETVSANPFQVRISWLDLQNNEDEKIVSREKLGFHIPCGRFKIASKTTINSVNVFSHVVDCDRAAREVYKIYPKKGSVWALYSEASLDAGEGKRCYDIVVFLTSYSEMNGMSMAFLEKVDGYKTVFKRHESGSYAVRFLGKDEFWLLSHQIPAQKFPCDEAPELLKDCWELDPASLPSDLLTIGGINN